MRNLAYFNWIPRVIAGAVLLPASACGGGPNAAAPRDAGAGDASSASDASLVDASDAAPDAGPSACSVIAAPSGAVLPHVSAIGANAAAVVQAIDAIEAAQTPPVLTSATAFPYIQCKDLALPPPQPSGYECSLQLPPPIDGGQPVTLHATDSAAGSTDAGPPLAQDLFDALVGAGATPCQDPNLGDGVVIDDLTATPDGVGFDVHFDDASNDSLLPSPNVVVQGAAAQGVLGALETAGVDDCDPARKVLLACSTFSGAPSCSDQWMALQKVGSSELLPICGPTAGSVTPGTTFGAGASQALWQAIVAAATKAAFQPSSGTVAQLTIFNASYFTWDGKNLGFTLTGSDASPPPPP